MRSTTYDRPDPIDDDAFSAQERDGGIGRNTAPQNQTLHPRTSTLVAHDHHPPQQTSVYHDIATKQRQSPRRDLDSMTHTRPSDAVVSLRRPMHHNPPNQKTMLVDRLSLYDANKVSFRSARSPSARTMRSPLSVAPTRAARARSHLSTVSSGSSTSTASPARSPTASPSPSALPLPRSSSPPSSSTRTVRRSLLASPRAVSSTRRRPRRLKYFDLKKSVV